MSNEMNKRPAFQFYPADWRKDPQLQMASMSTQGIWINLMCIMWESDPEGIISGTVTAFLRLLGCTEEELELFLDEAKELLFADVTKSNDIVMIKCRRMYQAFLEREGGKQRVREHRARKRYENVTPPSSTSSSSSLHTYTLEQVKSEAVLVGITEQQAEKWYNHYAAQGFVFGGGLPITDLKTALVRWRNNQYQFKDRKDVGTSKISGSSRENKPRKPFIR